MFSLMSIGDSVAKYLLSLIGLVLMRLFYFQNSISQINADLLCVPYQVHRRFGS